MCIILEQFTIIGDNVVRLECEISESERNFSNASWGKKIRVGSARPQGGNEPGLM